MSDEPSEHGREKSFGDEEGGFDVLWIEPRRGGKGEES